MPAGPSGKGNADAASGKSMGGGNRGRDGGNTGNFNGFKPSPGPTKVDMSTAASAAAGLHSPEAQAAANEAHRRANKLGVYAGLGPEKIDFDDMRALSQIVSPKKVDPTDLEAVKAREAVTGIRNAQARSLAKSYRSGLSSTMASYGAKFIAGVNSELTVDEIGNIGFQDSYSPTEQALELISKSTSPLVSGLVGSSRIAGKLGYSPHKSVSGFRTIGKATDQRVAGEARNRANREGDNGSVNPKSLFARAEQTLYPQEEQEPLFGVGISQGASKVRKAPPLSALNVRRALFGRV
ncbi:hypothetical protein [Kiloniella antarctica]|uniref:Minor capsid protein n=1 Tax=Kiloniella antarctica TaxID=1550907 RepID=A0ABW5BHH0_9PROT